MWEYRVIDLEGDRCSQWQDQLSLLGREGWELVGVHHFFAGNLIGFLKRKQK